MVERIHHRRPVRQRIIEVGRKKVVKVRERGLFALPNLFTTASLFCAFISIVQAMESNFGFAALMIMLSMLFDGMDGRVARLTHTQSEFGEQFDSIADMTAFGVAPALVMYKFCLFTLGGLGWAAAFIYCLCAGVRLARFNCNIGVVDKRFFQGLPSPAAAALLAGFVWLSVENKLPGFLDASLPWFAFVLTLYAGLTMVCNAPFYSGKSGVSLKNAPFIVMVGGAVVFILISSNPSLAIFTIFCLYALSGYVYQLWLFLNDKPNPVLPGEYAGQEDQSEDDEAHEEGLHEEELVHEADDFPEEQDVKPEAKADEKPAENAPDVKP